MYELSYPIHVIPKGAQVNKPLLLLREICNHVYGRAIPDVDQVSSYLDILFSTFIDTFFHQHPSGNISGIHSWYSGFYSKSRSSPQTGPEQPCFPHFKVEVLYFAVILVDFLQTSRTFCEKNRQYFFPENCDSNFFREYVSHPEYDSTTVIGIILLMNRVIAIMNTFCTLLCQ